MKAFVSRRRGRLCVWVAAACLACVCPRTTTPLFAQEPAPQDKPIGEAPDERNADDIFLRSQRVLLGRGQTVVDFGQFYSRSEVLQLAVVENSLALATDQHALFTTALVGRIGILSETELFAGASFNHLRRRLFVGLTELAHSTRSESGNVDVGVRRTVLREAPGRPDVIATFSTQLPTGDDPYTLGGGLVLVKSLDPVALFAGSNYRWSLPRDLDGGRRLESAHSVDVSLGYGLALNDRLAISTVASALFARAVALQSTASRRTDSFSLRFALTSSLARGLYIEPSVSLGLSGPGQSFAMGVTLPYSF
jgi:hypothetical protein